VVKLILPGFYLVGLLIST